MILKRYQIIQFAQFAFENMANLVSWQLSRTNVTVVTDERDSCHVSSTLGNQKKDAQYWESKSLRSVLPYLSFQGGNGFILFL